jgi:F-type H+-transporting ATPase subunit epsilon
MYLEILTPEEKYFEGEVSLVKLPGSQEKGSFEILENHAPIISALIGGILKIKDGEGERQFVIKEGFVEASENNVSVLVEGIKPVE